MRRRVLLGLLSCVLAVAAEAQSEDPCRYVIDREFTARVRSQNDAQLRQSLVACIENERDLWLVQKGDDARAERIEGLEKIAVADLTRLKTRRDALSKLEEDGTIDDDSFRVLQEIRASIRQLIPVVRLTDGKPVLVAGEFAEARKVTLTQAETQAAAAAANKEAKATSDCLETDAYTIGGNAKRVTDCIDRLRAERRKQKTGKAAAGPQSTQTAQAGSGASASGAQTSAAAATQQASLTTTSTPTPPKVVRRQLAKYEEAGRRLATETTEALAELKDKREKAATIEARNDLNKDIESASNDLKLLRERVIIPMEDARTEFADYEQWYSKFSTGYEYTTVSDAFSRGFMRVGLNIGFQYPRHSIPENDDRNWHYYGVYSMFSMALTNTGEASATPAPSFLASSARRVTPLEDEPENPPDPAQDRKPEIRRALEFESQFFIPVWRNDYQALNPRLRTRIGPLLVFGARKADDDTFAHHRAYVGIRNARSPDTYWDVLYGRTGGLESRRIEFRGQYQLQRFFPGSARLALGAVGNFGSNRRRRGSCEELDTSCGPDEPDSIRFYLNYELPGESILKMLGLGAAKSSDQ